MFKVDFQDKNQLLDSPDGELPPFGVTYEFTLTDAVESCPEYLVHPKVLALLGREYNLELLEYESFYEYYQQHIKTSEQ